MGALLSNNAIGVLAAGISAGDTSVTVNSGQGALFPSPSSPAYFYATLSDASLNVEIVKCTARSGDTMTITRAQQGTTARAYAAGDRIEIRVIAEHFNEKVSRSGDAMLGNLGVGLSSVNDLSGLATGMHAVEMPNGNMVISSDTDGWILTACNAVLGPGGNWTTKVTGGASLSVCYRDGSISFFRASSRAAGAAISDWKLSGSFSVDGYLKGYVNGYEGLYQSQRVYRLNSGIVGGNDTAYRSVIGVGVNLEANTVYEIEGQFLVTKSVGATSHFVNFMLGAANGLSLNNMMVQVISRYGATFSAIEPVDQFGLLNGLNTNLQISPAGTTAAIVVQASFKGTISVAAAGTLYPYYNASAAPGGAYAAVVGNYMKATPLGPAGTISVGSFV